MDVSLPQAVTTFLLFPILPSFQLHKYQLLSDLDTTHLVHISVNSEPCFLNSLFLLHTWKGTCPSESLSHSSSYRRLPYENITSAYKYYSDILLSICRDANVCACIFSNCTRRTLFLANTTSQLHVSL